MKNTSDPNHHLPERVLMELKIEHADSDALADTLAHAPTLDGLLFKRLKKRRLPPRDRISRLELTLIPSELA